MAPNTMTCSSNFRQDEVKDRTGSSNWFDAVESLRALDDIAFAVSAIASQVGAPGSHEREVAFNASIGVKRRIDYLHDSLRRLLNK